MWSWTKYHGHGRKLRLDLDDFLNDFFYFLGDDLFDRDLDNLLDLNHLLDGNFLPHDVHDLLGDDSFNLLSNDLLYRDFLDDDPLDRDLFGSRPGSHLRLPRARRQRIPGPRCPSSEQEHVYLRRSCCASAATHATSSRPDGQSRNRCRVRARRAISRRCAHDRCPLPPAGSFRIAVPILITNSTEPNIFRSSRLFEL